MKNTIKGFTKLYIIFFLYVFLSFMIYSLLIKNLNLNMNNYILITLSSLGFLLLGVLYGNMIHKKGIIVGLVVGLAHYLIFYFILHLTNNELNFDFINMILFTILSSIGGILGVNFKKII